MKTASNERREREKQESQGTQTDAESEMPRDQRELQTAAETPGISAQTTADANVGEDRTTHEANTVGEAHSALQAENQKLFEYAQSLQQHVDQLLAASRENGASMLALQISELEESNAALQQKRLAKGEWEVQDTYTANHVHALVAQMEEARTIQAPGYQAYQAALARGTQEILHLDERIFIWRVREGEAIAPQRTTIEEASMADREEAGQQRRICVAMGDGR